MGKGTQGVLLAQSRGARHLATGDLLRAAHREGTELGKSAQGYMDAGELVPDDVIVDLVKETLAALDPSVDVILDGFPRTVPQAEALQGALLEVDRRVDRVLLLEAPDDVLVKRIGGRRSSPTGRVYNIYFNPPNVEGICDDSGEALLQRADDEPDTVRRRLRVYQEQTEPLVAHYAAGIAEVVRVQGDQSVDAVQTDLVAALSERVA